MRFRNKNKDDVSNFDDEELEDLNSEEETENVEENLDEETSLNGYECDDCELCEDEDCNDSFNDDEEENLETEENEEDSEIEIQNSKELEYLNMAKRIQAEFENYKRRTKEQASESFKDGIVYSIKAILPVLDSFKQAQDQITDENSKAGMELIYSQLLKGLKDLGVEKIEAVGKPFNPKYHNAVMVDNEVENDVQTVLEEFQEGFMLNDKVIRYSIVKISK